MATDGTHTSSRGQTTQDFLVGVSVFLIAIAFVLGFFPQLSESYGAGAGAAESSVADRVASSVLANVTDGSTANDVNGTKAAEFFQNELAADSIHDSLAVPTTMSVNVTIESLGRGGPLEVTNASGSTVTLAGGQPYRDQSAITVTRVVTMSGDADACESACRLIVRVW